VECFRMIFRSGKAQREQMFSGLPPKSGRKRAMSVFRQRKEEFYG
jgi:hypothetical protein